MGMKNDDRSLMFEICAFMFNLVYGQQSTDRRPQTADR